MGVRRLQRCSSCVVSGLVSLNFLVPSEKGEIGRVFLGRADAVDRFEIVPKGWRKMGLVDMPILVATACSPGASSARADCAEEWVVMGWQRMHLDGQRDLKGDWVCLAETSRPVSACPFGVHGASAGMAHLFGEDAADRGWIETWLKANGALDRLRK